MTEMKYIVTSITCELWGCHPPQKMIHLNEDISYTVCTDSFKPKDRI